MTVFHKKNLSIVNEKICSSSNNENYLAHEVSIMLRDFSVLAIVINFFRRKEMFLFNNALYLRLYGIGKICLSLSKAFDN